MAEVKGMLVICDRPGCGRQTFRKAAGEGEADGGYTRWNKFEPLAEGWEHFREVGTLCPDCAREYKALIEKFKHAKEDLTDAADRPHQD